MKENKTLPLPLDLPPSEPPDRPAKKQGAPAEAPPTLEEWSLLFDEAESFRRLACWEWMTDEDIFAVVSPEDGAEGFCCVLGNAGEEFGLVLYLGGQGLLAHRMIQEGLLEDPTGQAMVMALDAVVVTFDEKSVLEEPDLDVVRRLGRTFGPHAWPHFRSYRRKYFPWHPPGAEARFLTQALGQARIVAERFRKNPDLLAPAGDELMFARVPVREGAELRWEDRRIRPKEPKPRPPAPFDEARARKLDLGARRATYTLETGFTLHPEPIQDGAGTRPFYASMLLAVENIDGLILGHHLHPPHAPDEALTATLLGAMEAFGALPSRIAVRDEETRHLFQPLAKALAVPILVTSRLPALDEAARSFEKFSASRGRGGKGKGRPPGRGRPKKKKGRRR
jgi:hypothetical protein